MTFGYRTRGGQSRIRFRNDATAVNYPYAGARLTQQVDYPDADQYDEVQ